MYKRQDDALRDGVSIRVRDGTLIGAGRGAAESFAFSVCDERFPMATAGLNRCVPFSMRDMSHVGWMLGWNT